jgi:hypothetical protein
MLVPRDIAMTVDLSGSMNDDSELKSYRDTPINLTQVWRDMAEGEDGPTWGNMVHWGVEDIDPDNYDPTADTGLSYMKYGQNWSYLDINNDGINDFDQLPSGYTTDEKNTLKSGTRDYYRSKQYYADRVAVMVRLADWNDNDGDSSIDSNEVSWTVPYPYSEGSWSD